MPKPRVARRLIEQLLHDSATGLRLIQDSPILVDVWAAFGEQPARRASLLLSPQIGMIPTRAAKLVADGLRTYPGRRKGHVNYVSPLQGFVTATVSFRELVDVLAPLLGVRFDVLSPIDAAKVFRQLKRTLDDGDAVDRSAGDDQKRRISALVALIGAAAVDSKTSDHPISDFENAASWLESRKQAAPAYPTAPFDPEKGPSLLRRATLNRQVSRLGWDSVRTVKADAARRVFDADASDLVWAVVDSGIDANHPAFAPDPAKPDHRRVWRAYDFSRLRRLTSYDILLDTRRAAYRKLAEDVAAWREAAPTFFEDQDSQPLSAKALLQQLAADAAQERPTTWALIEPLLRLPHATPIEQPHGTHVAGILAGAEPDGQVGVCPGLRLLDIRIIGTSAEDDDAESAVIGALEFIRWLNIRNRWRVVHGVNLSIGMKHDVRNWACGQTPICVACNDLVASGVVVVAAAGNDGWQSFLVGDEKRYEGYAACSIMDPGNAQDVITVGATHRDRPHLFGVSFFSSRGPTGDGRMKPDLVAPGEKIEGPLPNNGSGTLDGTSMAAPHVSGVAALLMARHVELQGKPAEIKRILMETAIDLGRDRSAQGAGLVNAFEALQRR